MNYLVKFVDSKIENIILNICILLFGINFLYKCNYIVMGTFILLLIFKKFKIDLGNIKVLIVLILFSISWYIFGGHELAGICLPMCYLIGSNIDDKDEKGIIKFVLLISISLALYTTSFFINNVINNGIGNYDVSNQLNIWTGRPLWATNIMLYSSLFMSLFGYIVFTNKDKFVMILYSIVFAINSFYALMLSRRAALLMIVVSLFLSFIVSAFYVNKEYKNKTIIIMSTICFLGIFLLVLFLVSFKYNFFGFKEFIKRTDLYVRFIRPGSIKHFFKDMGRMQTRIEFYKQMSSNFWGGNTISDKIGLYVHELWLDVYDASGIISFILIVLYTLFYIYKFISLIIKFKKDNSMLILLICIFACSIVQLSLEPIMEACRAYMFALCMIHGCLETISKNKI